MEGFDSEDEPYRRKEAAQRVNDGRVEVLVQSAMRRIAEARANRQLNVNLSVEEMEALERRRGPPSEPVPRPPPQFSASPPSTPAKTSKGKSGSRSNSSTSLSNQKTRRRGNTGLFGVQSSPSPAKSNSKVKVDRKPSNERSSSYSSGNGPPGVMVPGPDGRPVFAPLVNYAPSNATASRARAGSRSASKHSRRDSTPPERTDVYAQYPPRYYYPPSGMRPDSSSSNRSMQDDMDYYPTASRQRSASNAQYAAYRPADDYDAPSLPAAQGRRNVSGPANIQYSTLRRVPPASSPLAARPGAQHASSEPAGAGRKGSGLDHELERTSSSSSDDQGVQVNIAPGAIGGGYSVNRAPALVGSEGRRKKGWGR